MKIGKVLIYIILIATALSQGEGRAFAKAESQSAPFVDISDSFAKKQIVDLYHKKMISGITDRMFEPKKPVTRSEFMAFVVRILHLQGVANDIPSFTDVSRKAWYYGVVQAASNLQLTEGKGPQQFRPMDPVTRQETAVILMRMLKQQDVERVSGYPDFDDQERVAYWAVSDVRRVAELGLMTGSAGEFRPNDRVTREEMAAVLDRMLQNARWSAELQKPSPSGIQLGWQYDSTTAQYIAQVGRSSINTLSPRYHYLERDGSVSDKTDPALISWASAHGKKVWSMLGNRSNAQLTHSILADQKKRAWVIKQLGNYVTKHRLQGINVDFENVNPEDRANLTAFIKELAVELHRQKALLSVNVSPDLGTSWTAAFNYQSLGQSADYIVLMGYDEHWGGAPEAGSVSSLPWLERATDKLLGSLPPNKVIVGLPFYSREWTADTGAYAGDITLVRQGEIAASLRIRKDWKAELGQYVLEYDKQGVKYRIWAEESRSLSLKYEMAASRGISGFAYWFTGAETHDIWTSLHNAAKYTSYHFS